MERSACVRDLLWRCLMTPTTVAGRSAGTILYRQIQPPAPPRADKKQVSELAVFGGTPCFEEPLHVGRPNIGNRQHLLQRITKSSITAGSPTTARWCASSSRKSPISPAPDFASPYPTQPSALNWLRERWN